MRHANPASARTTSVNSSWDRPITQNERAWIDIIRLASWDMDPKPTLARVQRVRRAFDEEPPGQAVK